jgi:hypothetical protein
LIHGVKPPSNGLKPKEQSHHRGQFLSLVLELLVRSLLRQSRTRRSQKGCAECKILFLTIFDAAVDPRRPPLLDNSRTGQAQGRVAEAEMSCALVRERTLFLWECKSTCLPPITASSVDESSSLWVYRSVVPPSKCAPLLVILALHVCVPSLSNTVRKAESHGARSGTFGVRSTLH